MVHSADEHFSFRGSQTSLKNATAVENESDEEYVNFAEEYRIKQAEMLGELHSLYQEKSEWADKLKSVITPHLDEQQPLIQHLDDSLLECYND